jgi:4-amino-4-deoxy-L-arabinose transferase-like glycosyltransferase
MVNSRFYSDKFILLVILLAAAAMRFYQLGSISLSNDELSAMTRARYGSVAEVIDKGVMIDYHPAGVELFIYVWMKLFGDNAWIFRLPFVLFSLGSIYLIWRIGKCWFSSLAGLLGAAFFAVLEYPLLYSQLARMYSPGLFFSLLTVLYWTKIILQIRAGKKVERKDWLLFALAMALGAHTHYFVVVFIFSVGLLGFFYVAGKDRFIFLSCCVLSALSFALELKVFFTQMETGDLGGWLAPPKPDFLIDFLFNSLNSSFLLLFLLLQLFVFSFFYRQAKISFNKFHFAGIFWFLFSFGLGYAYSVLRAPALQYSTLLFAFPFFLLAILSIVPESYFNGWRKLSLVTFVLLVGGMSTILGKNYYSKPPFGVFKEVAEDLSDWNVRYGAHPCVVNVINPAYIDYYFTRSAKVPQQISYKVETVSDLVRLRETVDTSSSEYFSYGWTNNHHPYEINAIIRQRFPVIVERKSYFNAETWLFGKTGTDTISQVVKTWSMGYDDPSVSYGAVLFPTSKDGVGVLQFSTGMEYGPGIQEKLKIAEAEFGVMYCSVWFLSDDTTANQSLVLSFEKNGTAVQWDNVRLNDFNKKPGQWQQAFLARPLPAVDDSLDLKVYVWNSDKRTFMVDKLVAKQEKSVDPYLRK